MITISEFVVIGILEVLGILILGICGLLVYNHRLHKRGLSLATQLHQLKDTTRFLLTKVNEFNENTYATFLGKEVVSAQEQVSEFMVDDELHFLNEQCPEDKAKIMRYMLLEAELAAELAEDEAKKLTLRSGKLADIVSDFEKSTAASGDVSKPDSPTTEGDIDTSDLRKKWAYLVDASFSLIRQRTFQAENDLVDILQTINGDLGMAPIEPPESKETKGANSSTVDQLRGDADRSREVISKLLAERNAAEEQVSVKASELEKMQRFLKESEVCIGLIESELHEAHKELENHKNLSEHDPAEMQSLIQRFSQESSEMLMCIETLEQENSDLKSQLGLS